MTRHDRHLTAEPKDSTPEAIRPTIDWEPKPLLYDARGRPLRRALGFTPLLRPVERNDCSSGEHLTRGG